ncbi:MAG: helix-turn-helix domain-containing protein [Sphingomonadales bacterium]|nr:helix-turn-helix domain-containing protein [Sphingomonadales bacterium]
MKTPRSYTRLTEEALVLLGAQIKLGRKSRSMAETELAERAGIARSTVQKIEKGDPHVAIGLVFEAAVIAGVPLFVPEASSLAPQIDRMGDKIALLPRSIRKSRIKVDDDF